MSVPTEFRTMIGYGVLVTAGLALLALVALRNRFPRAIAFVWVCVNGGTRFIEASTEPPRDLARLELIESDR